MNKSSLPEPPIPLSPKNCFIAANLFHNYVTRWRVTLYFLSARDINNNNKHSVTSRLIPVQDQ